MTKTGLVKERPILFSAPMVRAILAGSKTQTRRVVKPQPFVTLEVGSGFAMRAQGCRSWAGDFLDVKSANIDALCPYGQPGDRLWVKEQTLKIEDHGWIGPVYTESDAGRDALAWGYGESDDPDHIPPHAIKRRPSIFMTRAMSRITLEVTGVRVERLKSISRGDAMAEGCPASGDDPRKWYAELWDHINGAGSWDANPWVWVLSFRRLP